jgi:glycogen synthase
MRILFLSAFYPPYEIGGWEQLVQELAEGLAKLGHEVTILTSSPELMDGNKINEISNEPRVRIERALRLENDLRYYNPSRYFLRHQTDLRKNFSQLQRIINTRQPEVTMVHSMWNLSRRIPWFMEKMFPSRVVYYLADYWPVDPDVNEAFWNKQAGRVGVFNPKKILANLVLNRLTKEQKRYRLAFDRVVCVSRAVQEQLVKRGFEPARSANVIYNGINIQKFSPCPETNGLKMKPLLYVGSLASHKGIKTVIEAMAKLNQDPSLKSVSLKIAGDGHPGFTEHLKGVIHDLNLDEQVELLGRIEREKMPDLYRQSQALVFPSIWNEPLARTTQEAMACGLPVISTLTGGTGELISEGVNGLTFPAGDPDALASQIKRVRTNPDLARRLGQSARETVVKRFDIDLMIRDVEKYLARICEQEL